MPDVRRPPRPPCRRLPHRVHDELLARRIARNVFRLALLSSCGRSRATREHVASNSSFYSVPSFFRNPLALSSGLCFQRTVQLSKGYRVSQKLTIAPTWGSLRWPVYGGL